MINSLRLSVLCTALLLPILVCAQDAVTPAPEPSATEPPTETAPAVDSVQDALRQGEQKAKEIARDVDNSPQAKELTAGILQPIYQLAELLSFSAFHWVAFAVMATGVVSFALQLVIGKLVVLTRLHLSFTEILSDALGLVISLVGLVLTTQAATENSSFTQSPASVLSATAVGIVVGFMFYLWGQSQELKAARAAALEAHHLNRGR